MRILTAALLSIATMCGAQETQPPSKQAPENPPPEGGRKPRQEENKNTQVHPAQQRWNLYWQATSIGQYHGKFRSPYQGENSLSDLPERDVSLTSTLYLGLRLDQNTQIYINPELAGGRGFSNVTGIANFPNGEMPRVATATPKPYLARAYIQHDFGWGSERESFDSELNQLAGSRPVKRFTTLLGRFTVTDFFDNNRYSHDPRTQFMGWGMMYNGAWDYPADTRGYTWGWFNELHLTNWSFRYASVAEPKVANGLRIDRRLFRDRGDMFEVERRYTLGENPGAIRALGFLLHTNSGSYGEAIAQAAPTGETPDVTSTRRIGTLKYGFGLNVEQQLTRDIGVFGRVGWNDGQSESFAFTAIDHLVSAGTSITGRRWRRPDDVAGTALTMSGLSAVHARYLALGGLDFLIGDGRLNYGREAVWESYYSARLIPGFFTSFDLQHVANPAYNRDRGPVWVASIRLHVEVGR
jgi:high affinity Mn2+ porin